ncbi:MAG: MOSC domain-containing protein [Planctomycetota bacterium]
MVARRLGMVLETIWLRPAARLPVREVMTATASAGVGLEGDHAVGGRRQVTLLSREAWDLACADLGRAVDPAARRANLLLRGVDLGAAIGRSLRVGAVTLDILGETRPCELLDDGNRVGLCAALRPQRRGGVFGTVRIGGVLRVGDACVVL